MGRTLDQLAYLSLTFLVLVRISGIICLLGVGLGFSFASWLVCRFLRGFRGEEAKEHTDIEETDDVEVRIILVCQQSREVIHPGL